MRERVAVLESGFQDVRSALAENTRLTAENTRITVLTKAAVDQVVTSTASVVELIQGGRAVRRVWAWALGAFVTLGGAVVVALQIWNLLASR